MEYTIDEVQKVVFVRFTGEITDTDLIGIARETTSNPKFDPSFSEVVDLSGVTGGKVSTFAVQTVARRTSVYDRASKHVVIAPQPHGFGLSRMFQVFAEESRPNMVIVKTMDEACECLGLERKPTSPHPNSEGEIPRRNLKGA